MKSYLKCNLSFTNYTNGLRLNFLIFIMYITVSNMRAVFSSQRNIVCEWLKRGSDKQNTLNIYHLFLFSFYKIFGKPFNSLVLFSHAGVYMDNFLHNFIKIFSPNLQRWYGNWGDNSWVKNIVLTFWDERALYL